MRNGAGKGGGDSTDSKQNEMPIVQSMLQRKRPQTATNRTFVHPEGKWSTRSQRDRSSSCSLATEKAQHVAALNGARKSRYVKFESRFTFSHNNPKYYFELPAQPATGWWKALVKHRRQSPAFVDRLCKNLDILLPDTLYATSTECYYITNNSLALTSDSSSSQSLSLPENAWNGWLIKEDFTASKLFERNAALYLASSGFPGGKMMRRSAPQSLRSDQRRTIQMAMAVPAAVVKQQHYVAANRNITKALDLSSTAAFLADSSSERLVQVRHY